MITLANLDSALLRAVPDVRFRYEQELRSWHGGRPGPHIVFGDVLAPMMIADLDAGKDTLLLKRAFEFLEELAVSADADIRDVVGQAVGEQLCEREDFKRIRQLMGPATAGVIEAACSLRHRRRQ